MLYKIQELSQARHIDSEAIDLEADFDPQEHDRKMARVYDEEYYDEVSARTCARITRAWRGCMTRSTTTR
jgi:hypothetical protein